MSEFRTALASVAPETITRIEEGLRALEENRVETTRQSSADENDWSDVLDDDPDPEEIIQAALGECEIHESAFLFRGLAALVAEALECSFFRETPRSAAGKAFDWLFPHDEGGAPLLSNAVITSTLVSVEATSELHHRLSRVSHEKLEQLYDPAILGQMEIYPSEDWFDAETKRAILGEFEPLKAFIGAVANRRHWLYLEVLD